MNGDTVKLLGEVRAFLNQHEAYIDDIRLYRELNHFVWYISIFISDEKMQRFILERTREGGLPAEDKDDRFFCIPISMSEECKNAAKNIIQSPVTSMSVLIEERQQIEEALGVSSMEIPG